MHRNVKMDGRCWGTIAFGLTGYMTEGVRYKRIIKFFSHYCTNQTGLAASGKWEISREITYRQALHRPCWS
jgi:hypothetical protein